MLRINIFRFDMPLVELAPYIKPKVARAIICRLDRRAPMAGKHYGCRNRRNQKYSKNKPAAPET